MTATLFKIVVHNGTIAIPFACHVHHSTDPKDHLLEPEFYRQFNGIPQGSHHELEITEGPEKQTDVPIHIHVNPHTKRRFVCWTNALPTEEDAWSMFHIWAVGTTYSLTHKKDFGPLMKEGKDKFLALMERDYGIKVDWTSKIT